MTGVTAGAVEPVHQVTLEHCAAQQAVGVRGQADIVTAGLPYVGPYNVDSILNPILVMCMGLGYFFNLYHGVPLVREGGVMIFTHPVTREFHPVHHPSYVDFYEEVLSETTDPLEIERRFEKDYAEDEWYRHLYRTSHAYHGVHPFYMWYWGAHALQHLGDVIFVGGNPEACRRLGFRRADTMRDALEMAEQVVGPRPVADPLPLPAAVLRAGRSVRLAWRLASRRVLARGLVLAPGGSVRFAAAGAAEKLAGGTRQRERVPRRWRTVTAGRDPWADRTAEDEPWLRERAPGDGPRGRPAGAALPGHARVHDADHHRRRGPHPRAPARDPRPEPRVRHRHAAGAARAPVRLAHATPSSARPRTAGTASAATRSPRASGSTPSRSTAAAASAAASPRPPHTCARAATSCSSRRAPAAPAPRATAPASPSSP